MKKFIPLIIIAAAGIVLVFNSELLGDLEGNPNEVYHISVADTEPEQRFLAAELYELRATEEAWNAITEKVIGVEGTITSVGRTSTGSYAVKLRDKITLSFNQDEKMLISNLKKGQYIQAKGINIGYSKQKDRVVLILCKIENVK